MSLDIVICTKTKSDSSWGAFCSTELRFFHCNIIWHEGKFGVKENLRNRQQQMNYLSLMLMKQWVIIVRVFQNT
jgi:hypothetical protein